jgi:hypothetical protein
LCDHRTEAVVSYENLRFLAPARRADLVRARDDYELGLRELIERARTDLDIAPDATPLLAKVVLGIVNWPYQWFRSDGPMSSSELAPVLAGRALAALRK